MSVEEVSKVLKFPLLTCEQAREPYLSTGREVPVDISFSCLTDGVSAVDEEKARHTEVRFVRGLNLFDENIFVTLDFFDGALTQVQVDFDFSVYQAPRKRVLETASKLRERFEKTMGAAAVTPSDTIDGGISLVVGDLGREAAIWVNPNDNILNFAIWDRVARDQRKRQKAQRDESAIQ